MPVTREQVLQELKRRGYNGPIPEQGTQLPQQQNQPNELSSTLEKLKLYGLIPQQRNFGHAIADAMSILGGGQPIEPEHDDMTKLIEQETIKRQFEEPNYVVSYDENNQPFFTQAPGNIKNAPFYSTPAGQSYYQAGARQREAQGQQALTETQLMNTVLPKVQQAIGDDKNNDTNAPLPPGMTVNAGPISFQPNPRLTDTEQAAIAGSQALEPVVERIIQTVRGGIYSQGNDFKRTIRQAIVDSGQAILSSKDDKLQAFQSDINNLKRLIPFTDGGKQLTPFEARRVFALLNTVGKNDKQIETDITAAVSIVMAKGGLAIGGRNVAIQGQQQPLNQTSNVSSDDFSKMSEEELRKIAGNI